MAKRPCIYALDPTNTSSSIGSVSHKNLPVHQVSGQFDVLHRSAHTAGILSSPDFEHATPTINEGGCVPGMTASACDSNHVFIPASQHVTGACCLLSHLVIYLLSKGYFILLMIYQMLSFLDFCCMYNDQFKKQLFRLAAAFLSSATFSIIRPD